MKKNLPALAALVLAGCAHSQDRTTYLQEYAGFDCTELRTERLTVEAELDSRWRKGYSSRSRADSVQSSTVTSIDSPYTIYEIYPPTIDVSPAKVRRQKDQIRHHAKWQALVQLERNKGCRHEVSGPESLRVDWRE